MKYVKLNQQVGNRQEGEVIRVDDGSAASLVEKGVGEIVDSRDGATRTAARRGNVAVVQVADADDPNAVVGEPVDADAKGAAAEVVDGDGQTHTGELPAPDSEQKKDEKPADTPASKRGKAAENVGQPETPPAPAPPA
ncbi:uncharacterized protein RMCC_1394 [Mycolicibacterium canariasense]|uniref:Uncharacterized protein n=1 Tax=Mycolicibacterium canariasense TaxID=228230 RepID=A0A117I984_MYCCR|nr:hypothetical protein [Mycolicibacterium canariasense]MCV7208785.1 hypothetical protein [Mycolicibacterium canariasense]ORV07148.1 hypothetical protein AWB94_14195 [Mycolicibacterium canariasense]GAS94428.1 uncharacterized protein RMCC_1394 [Mycolicibacterium canariasense]